MVGKGVATQYNGFATNYTNRQVEFYKSHPDITRSILYDTVTTNLKKKRVLDLGCGFGLDMKWLSEKGAHPYGVDSSEKMIAEAKEDPFGIMVVKDLSDTNFPKDFFDHAISRYAIDYVRDLDSVFKEVYRVLKSNGTFTYVVNHPELLKLAAQQDPELARSEKLVNLPAFNGDLSFTKQLHNIEDYLSKFVLDHFEVLDIVEGQEHPDKFPVPGKTEHTLDFLVVKLRKLYVADIIIS
jgi:ubiquinone/menaquinone biosynthesis C-methylase UbiE